MIKLVLFDIDGTLIESSGLGLRSMLAALEEVFGRPFARNGVKFAGRTDPLILRDLMLANGVAAEQVPHSMGQVLEALPRNMRILVREIRVIPLPGVQPLLAILPRQENIALGLITGNIQRTAPIKLAHAGIDPRQFQIGAYGSDAADRNALPSIALRRAEKAFGRAFAAHEALIVGDTPADIACARVHRMKVLAVGTGRFSMDQLSTYQPDFLFPNLSDLAAVVATLRT
jgi:phosphoglycolate phosphatase-like HAD superfamily hydrolase